MSPETRYAKNGDVFIAYQVTGEGPDTLLYAPGTVSHLDLDWEFPLRAEFFRRLSSMFRLVRFDKRGTGLSDRPTAMATLEQRADDIRAVMDAVAIESAFIFGMSEGASMAAMFAATHPRRTRALLIWGGVARFVATADHPWGPSQDEADRLVRDVQDHWPSEWYVRGPGAGLGPGADDALVQFAIRYCRAAASPSAAVAYERMNAQIDIRPILGAIKVPALVMNRTGDPVAACEGARDMANRIPGARFIEFPDDTHSVMALAPERVFAEIQAFVTGTRPIANTAGDGFMASFDGPGRAIRCALAIVSAVKPLELEVRAGLHTGEVELMGDNIGGIAVHLAARISAEAAASQVVVSSTTRDLVAGSGIAFEPRGSTPLKGVPGEWALFVATA